MHDYDYATDCGAVFPVGAPAGGLREAAHPTASDQEQVGAHGGPTGVSGKLARDCYLPNDQDD